MKWHLGDSIDLNISWGEDPRSPFVLLCMNFIWREWAWHMMEVELQEYNILMMLLQLSHNHTHLSIQRQPICTLCASRWAEQWHPLPRHSNKIIPERPEWIQRNCSFSEWIITWMIIALTKPSLSLSKPSVLNSQTLIIDNTCENYTSSGTSYLIRWKSVIQLKANF